MSEPLQAPFVSHRDNSIVVVFHPCHIVEFDQTTGDLRINAPNAYEPSKNQLVILPAEYVRELIDNLAKAGWKKPE